ncbi:MAG: hypothetical protein Fur003_2690 [Candidatus Dojkabacteria bacterium]
MSIYKKSVISTIIGSTLISASPVFAQAAPPRINDIGTRILNIVNLSFPFAALVTLFMLVFGGYMWMVSAGDPQKLQRAQQTMVWAILGFIFLAVMRISLTSFFNFLGVQI